jgi:hypothetical protein
MTSVKPFWKNFSPFCVIRSGRILVRASPSWVNVLIDGLMISSIRKTHVAPLHQNFIGHVRRVEKMSRESFDQSHLMTYSRVQERFN